MFRKFSTYVPIIIILLLSWGVFSGLTLYNKNAVIIDTQEELERYRDDLDREIVKVETLQATNHELRGAKAHSDSLLQQTIDLFNEHKRASSATIAKLKTQITKKTKTKIIERRKRCCSES